MGNAPSVGIALGIVMHVSILLAGIALLVCRAPKLPEHSRPVICIQERIFVSVLAFIVWPPALFLLLIAFGYWRPASSGCSIWSDHVSDRTGTSHLRDLDAAGRKKPQIVCF